MALLCPQPSDIEDPERVPGLYHESTISIPDRGEPTKCRHFYKEENADASAGREGIERAFVLAGAWRDLDYNEMKDALNYIGHESVPTPPIEFDCAVPMVSGSLVTWTLRRPLPPWSGT